MQYRRILALIVVAFTLAGCEGEPDESLAPIADFSFEFRGDCSTPVLEVLFENTSQFADSYTWDFGDGTTSTDPDPVKVYAKAGTYTVTLTAIRDGSSNQLQEEVTIIRNSDGTGPQVSLDFERTDVTTLGVRFLIESDGLQYTLSFGDGQTLISNEHNVVHTYSGAGTYTASIVVNNVDGVSCVSLPIQLNP